MVIHQIVIKISFDGLPYCEYRSRISGLIVPELSEVYTSPNCETLQKSIFVKSRPSVPQYGIQMIVRLLYC